MKIDLEIVVENTSRCMKELRKKQETIIFHLEECYLSISLPYLNKAFKNLQNKIASYSKLEQNNWLLVRTCLQAFCNLIVLVQPFNKSSTQKFLCESHTRIVQSYNNSTV